MSLARIGISGWTFPPWRGTFYPKKLPQKQELEYAAKALTSIEINGTFYSLQKPGTFQSWHEQTPDDFQFAVKAPQFITHVLRLKDCEEPLSNFFASGLLCLGRKLGPILWQFPPNVTLKDDRFERFLRALPQDSDSAAQLALRHGKKVEGRSWTTVDESFPVRHAFEFRHKSFATPEFLELLRAYNVAFVIAHGAEKGPYVEDLTADFVYVRLHGEGKKYSRGYPAKELGQWAERVRAWQKGGQIAKAQCVSKKEAPVEPRDVYVYFSNEAKVFAPVGAKKLLALLNPAKEKKKAA